MNWTKTLFSHAIGALARQGVMFCVAFIGDSIFELVVQLLSHAGFYPISVSVVPRCLSL